jgi:hypothetical protein
MSAGYPPSSDTSYAPERPLVIGLAGTVTFGGALLTATLALALYFVRPSAAGPVRPAPGAPPALPAASSAPADTMQARAPEVAAAAEASLAAAGETPLPTQPQEALPAETTAAAQPQPYAAPVVLLPRTGKHA